MYPISQTVIPYALKEKLDLLRSTFRLTADNDI
jgi:hypothetical protein